GAQLIDLDQAVEQKAGAAIQQIFAERGEAAFRRLERETLLELLERAEGKKLVISLGGGALLDREFRVEVLARAVVVVLTASVDEIVRRIQAQDGDSGARPLLSSGEGTPETRVQVLLD